MSVMHNPPHPGELVREAMGPVDITGFAVKLGVGRVTLSRLLNGKSGISAGMALSLGDALNTSAEMWMGMQSQYDLWQARKIRRTQVRSKEAKSADKQARRAA